jgi:CRISPR system Cascade subunit CasC
MLGTVEFNSSCYYRYAVLNVDLLRRNLGADAGLAADAVRAFLRSMIEAVPSGKQNSFAAHNPCTFVAVAVRSGAPMNLANAFEKPVHHSESPDGLTAASVARLQSTWARYAPAFGIDASVLRTFDLTGAWPNPSAPTVDRLIDDALKAIDAQAA